MSFCLVNFAALAGTLHCFFGKTFGQWKPERGGPSPIPVAAMGPSRPHAREPE